MNVFNNLFVGILIAEQVEQSADTLPYSIEIVIKNYRPVTA